MTSAIDYNTQQMRSGALTTTHITEMVRSWQGAHELEVDGKAGPNTIASINAALPAPAADRPFLHSPLPRLPDARDAVITSEFRPPDRPNHDGVDWFYRWKAGDQPDFIGDKGCAGKNSDGTPKWCVPYGVCAIAACAGVIQLADNSPTGYRIWIDHGNGWRTGHFHLLDMRVHVGQRVEIGALLGLVGDNPSDNDGRHLHFELSPVGSYAPTDPVPYLLP